MAEVSASRKCAAWSLSLLALAGSLLGLLGVYVVASKFAAGTAWWVGVGFLGSAPAAISAIIISLRRPRLGIPVWLSSAALFCFVALWVLLIAIKVAS